MCMCHTLPAKTPISQMLERYVVGAAAAAGVQPPRDVEVRCLRTAAHFMDAVISDTAHMTALSRVIACLQTRAVFTTDLQYVLQQEATLRAAERDAPDAVHARPSLRRVVARVLHERAYYSTQTFATWSSQLQFGVTTSLHAQMLLYFVCAQVSASSLLPLPRLLALQRVLTIQNRSSSPTSRSTATSTPTSSSSV